MHKKNRRAYVSSYLYAAFFSMLALSCILISRPAEASELELFVGEVRKFDAGTIVRVAVGNEGIVDVSPLETGELLLLGKSAGVSDIYIWTAGERLTTYKVRVYAQPQQDRLSLIQSVLTPYPNVSITQEQSQYILTGKVDARDYEKFESITRGFRDVISYVKPELNVAIEESIVFDVRILEINRNTQRRLGIRWADAAPGPVVGAIANIAPNDRFGVVSGFEGLTQDLRDILGVVGSSGSRFSGYAGWTSILGSQLDLLQEEGVVRMLAQPSLSTISGEPATFLAGGELPIPVLNSFGQPVVEFREFGIQLEIEPIMDRNRNIRAKIKAAVSSVDFSTTVNAIPGLLERSTSSTITTRPGETIIISGLLSSEDARGVNKLPGLGDLPIIGKLFRSEDFRKARTELLITVTPRIQIPGATLKGNLAEAEKNLQEVLKASDSLDKALMW